MTIMHPDIASATSKAPAPSQEEIDSYLTKLLSSSDAASAFAFEVVTDASDYSPQSSLFKRLDSSPDDEFYADPKFTEHIDAAAVEALTKRNSKLIKNRDQVLDLGASHVSHLGSLPQTTSVSGLGMNEQEVRRKKMCPQQQSES